MKFELDIDEENDEVEYQLLIEPSPVTVAEFLRDTITCSDRPPLYSEGTDCSHPAQAALVKAIELTTSVYIDGDALAIPSAARQSAALCPDMGSERRC